MSARSGAGLNSRNSSASPNRRPDYNQPRAQDLRKPSGEYSPARGSEDSDGGVVVNPADHG